MESIEKFVGRSFLGLTDSTTSSLSEDHPTRDTQRAVGGLVITIWYSACNQRVGSPKVAYFEKSDNLIIL